MLKILFEQILSVFYVFIILQILHVFQIKKACEILNELTRFVSIIENKSDNFQYSVFFGLH